MRWRDYFRFSIEPDVITKVLVKEKQESSVKEENVTTKAKVRERRRRSKLKKLCYRF